METMHTEQFAALSLQEVEAINGGGFAYDVGRGLRFFLKAGMPGDQIHFSLAVIDWIINDEINKSQQ